MATQLRLIAFAVGASLGVSTGVAQAQTASSETETPWYQVEVLIFTQPNQDLSAELWDLTTSTTLSEERIELVSEDNAADTNNTVEASSAAVTDPDKQFVLLPADQHSLPINLSALNQRGYTVLFHGAWQQPMLSRQESLPVHIHNQPQLYTDPQIIENSPEENASEASSYGFYQRFDPTAPQVSPPAIDGEISLDIARYLHLRTNLYYSLDAPDYWRIAQAQKQTQQQKENESQAGIATGEVNRSPWESIFSTTPTDSAAEQLEENVEKQPRLLTVNMKQARRMRGDEVHYLDHPLFGMVIRLNKIDPPQVEPEALATPSNEAVTTSSASPSEVIQNDANQL